MQIPAPTNRFSARRATLFATAAAATLFALPQTASAAAFWPDKPVAPTAQIAFELFLVVFVVGLIAVLAFAAKLRGAARAEVNADAAPVAESSTKGAVVGAVVLFVVLAILGGFGFAKTTSAEPSQIGPQASIHSPAFNQPGLKKPNTIKPPKRASLAIRVNAQQYLWRYQYTDVKGNWNTYSYNTLVLPAGITVLLDFTSSDAEAAWWVPQLGGSVTALPGYDNMYWVRADNSEANTTLSGAGTVVNGTNYANMTTNVRVVPFRDYVRFVATKQLEIDGAMTALGLERASGMEEQLITGQKGAAAGTAASEAAQTAAADKGGKNK